MSRYQQAVNEFKELLNTQPPDPYTGRKRRPNNYRYQPEYEQWIKERQEWAGKLAGWHRRGIEVHGDAQEAKVTLHGETVPGTVYRKQPAGWLLYEADRPFTGPAEPCAGWAPKIRMPAARENLDLVFEHDEKKSLRWWDLKYRIQSMTQNQGIHIYDEFMSNNRNNAGFDEHERELTRICRQASEEWAEAVKRLLDAGAVTRLRKWTGQKAGHNLLNHNLAIISAGPLAEAARTNPGALAWWMHELEEISERWRPDEPPPPPPFPRHPGEIIARVRQEYAEAGGRRWKALASQPASHVAAMLKTHGREATAWLSEAVSEASGAEAPVPQPAPQPDPAMQPAAARSRAQQTLFGEAPAPRPPAPPRKRPEPAKPQAPAEVKLMLLELHWQILGKYYRGRYKPMLGSQPPMMRDDGTKERTMPALRRIAALALRQYAGAEPPAPNSRGKRQLIAEFQDLADYMFSNPAGAARAGTWKGLKKAVRNWHGERNLEMERQRLAREIEENAGQLRDWETPIRRMKFETGFEALVLTSAHELIIESRNLSHCVGGSDYAELCREGRIRIVHLAPLKYRPEDRDTPKKELGTTLQISCYDGRWDFSQHRGYANRIPDDEEREWASEFMKAWRPAAAELREKLLEQARKEVDQLRNA